MFENKETNPAYGMLSFSRVSGGDPNLFGSSVKHNQKIMLTLKSGHVCRELNNDWYCGDATLYEVEMSYTQFAELVSAMNVGDGVPVTIRFTEKLGHIPGIETVNRRSQFVEEFANANAESAKTAKELLESVKSVFAEKRPIKAAEREQIMHDLTLLYNALNSHNAFMMDQFNESMERVSTEAKGEVEAFIQNKMNSLALASMKENGMLDLHSQNPLLPDDNR